MSFAAVYAIGSVYNLKQAWPGTEVTKSSAQPRGLSVGGAAGMFGFFKTEQTKFSWLLQLRSFHFPFPSLFDIISVQPSCRTSCSCANARTKPVQADRHPSHMWCSKVSIYRLFLNFRINSELKIRQLADLCWQTWKGLPFQKFRLQMHQKRV